MGLIAGQPVKNVCLVANPHGSNHIVALGLFMFKGRRYKKQFSHPSISIMVRRAAIWVRDLRAALGADRSVNSPVLFRRQNRKYPQLPYGVTIFRDSRRNHYNVVASCTFGRKRLHAVFSVNKYGEREAIRLAIEQREKWIKYAESQPRFDPKTPPFVGIIPSLDGKVKP